MQPNGVGIPDDEFLDGQALNQLGSRNPFLLSVDEDRHVLLFSLAPGSLFGGGSFAFRFHSRHSKLVASDAEQRRWSNGRGRRRQAQQRVTTDPDDAALVMGLRKDVAAALSAETPEPSQ